VTVGPGRCSRQATALAFSLAVATAVSARQAPDHAPAAAAEAAGTIQGIRIHGNHTTPDADILAIAGVRPGQAAGEGLAEALADRLRASGRFRHVEVRTRYASIADPSLVVLVVIVEERAGISVADPTPGAIRQLAASTMWIPVLQYEDGHGFTYGARVTIVEPLGPRTRVSAPLTWGGDRRAGLEVERTFARGPVTRLEASAAIARRENPAHDVGDRRTTVAARVERAFGPSLRVAGTATRASVSFGGADDRISTAGVGVVADTRHDPTFPRNAVFASVEWERVWFDRARDTHRARADLRGFLGLIGQSVLAVRAQHAWAADPLPAFEQPFAGGGGTLRGYAPGARVGDRLAALSGEIRVPLSSPLSVGKAGVTVFVDSAATYLADGRLAEARFDTGAGAGLFVALPVLSVRLDVARGIGRGTRAHFALGVTF
jgi:outer membrane protein assembly factor BamA